jgi:hypothetical protein
MNNFTFFDYVLENYIENDSDFLPKLGQIFQPLQNEQQTVANRFMEN